MKLIFKFFIVLIILLALTFILTSGFKFIELQRLWNTLLSLGFIFSTILIFSQTEYPLWMRWSGIILIFIVLIYLFQDIPEHYYDF